MSSRPNKRIKRRPGLEGMIDAERDENEEVKEFGKRPKCRDCGKPTMERGRESYRAAMLAYQLGNLHKAPSRFHHRCTKCHEANQEYLKSLGSKGLK